MPFWSSSNSSFNIGPGVFFFLKTEKNTMVSRLETATKTATGPETIIKLHYDAVKPSTPTVSLHHLPGWMKDEKNHITRGFRLETKSVRGCYNSLWYLHNESVNIWSHLLVGIFFLSMFLWSTVPSLHGSYTLPNSDIRLLQFYLVGTVACLFFSVSLSMPTNWQCLTKTSSHSTTA